MTSNQTPFRCHDADACALGQKPCPTPGACGAQPQAQQPEALRHAAWLKKSLTIGAADAAAELERQHAHIAELEARQAAHVAALTEVVGCFDAANVEGLDDALVNNTDARLTDLVQRRLMHASYAAIQALAHAAPADPMDWPLPCDVTVGHGTMRKGVALRTLVLRMKGLYKMATGNDADEVAARTPEQRAELLAALQAQAAPAAQAVEPAAIDPEQCAQDVFDKGVSVGLFDIPKAMANAICKGLSSATGMRVDWHYIGGRVHMKALAAAPAPAAVAVPDGFALVPLTPTAEMLERAGKVDKDGTPATYKTLYITMVAAALAVTPPSQAQDVQRDSIRQLIAQHASLLEQNEYAYFELAYHRRTGWMAWITDKPLCMPPVENPDRKVIAKGQGDTPEAACDAAIAASAAKGGE